MITPSAHRPTRIDVGHAGQSIQADLDTIGGCNRIERVSGAHRLDRPAGLGSARDQLGKLTDGPGMGDLARRIGHIEGPVGPARDRAATHPMFRPSPR
ncbi:MAG TPA: hypothetical protein VNB87_06925 [Propionibacteriaceae bacterium]|nr:hypothetical protein [Propionibacteriaceae bacterium]